MRARFPLVALAMLSLLAALWAGLLRAGMVDPFNRAGARGRARAAHGRRLPRYAHQPRARGGDRAPLDVRGAAVLRGRRWTDRGGVCAALGALLVTLGAREWSGSICSWFAASRWHSRSSWRSGRSLGSSATRRGCSARRSFAWSCAGAAFLVLTIVGERLELSRLMRLGRLAEIAFAGTVAIVLAGTIVDLGMGLAMPADSAGFGSRLAGIGMIALALWLLRNDIARRTVRQSGVTRFTALALLSGTFGCGPRRAAGGIRSGCRGRGVRCGLTHGLCGIRSVDDLWTRAHHPAGGARPGDGVSLGHVRAPRASPSFTDRANHGRPDWECGALAMGRASTCWRC